MATSRTGTGKWKRIRAQAIAQAKANSQDQCPKCGTHLDLDGTGMGAPIDVDHAIPHSQGGKDSIDNAVVMCRTCNRAKGDGTRRRRKAIPQRVEAVTRYAW